jgi:hypothetical protein
VSENNCVCSFLVKEGKKLRCSLMGISAKPGKMDPETGMSPDRENPDAIARSQVVCNRQLKGWLPNAIPCRVPTEDVKEYKIPVFKAIRIAEEACQVLNRVVEEPSTSCGHCDYGGSFTPPKCTLTHATCPIPETQKTCPLPKIADAAGDMIGPKAQDDIDNAYDRVWFKATGVLPEFVDEDSEIRMLDSSEPDELEVDTEEYDLGGIADSVSRPPSPMERARADGFAGIKKSNLR